MRSQNTFYFFLTDAEGRSAIWQNNTVVWTTPPTPLRYSPEGWQETQLSWTRSAKYHGINRQFTNPYTFVEDGASILRYLLYTQSSYESKVYCIICKWNDATDVYEAYYRGEIDLVKAKDQPDKGITVNMLEGDLLKLLDANDDTDFEIPLDGDYTQLVQLDGLRLQTTQPFQQINIGSQELGLNHIAPMVQLQGEGTPVNLQYGQQDYEQQIGTDSDFYTASANCLLRYSALATSPITFTLRGQFSATLTDSASGQGAYILYYIIASDTTFGQRTAISSNAFNPIGESHTFEVDETITLQPGQKLFIAGRSYANTPGDSIPFEFEFGESQLVVDGTDKYRTTLVKAIRPYELYKQLLSKVFAGRVHTATSQLLQNTFAHLVCTCGDAIRDLEAPILKTSFSKFFDAFNKITFAGFGISGLEAIFETRGYFYPTATNTLSLGEVSDLAITISEEHLANLIKVGYPSQDIEALNGKFSFNNTSQFALPVEKVKKDYDQVSPYLTDPYVIEGIRVQFGGKNTTDSKSDNNVFILNTISKAALGAVAEIDWAGAPDFQFTLYGQASRLADFAEEDAFIISGTDFPAIFDGYYTVAAASVAGADLLITVNERPNSASANFSGTISFPLILRRQAYDTLVGVPDTANVYNIEDLTPKRMLLRHGPWIRSLLYFFTLERLEFTTADRNKELSTELAGNIIAEKTSVRVDTLGSPMFYPFLFTFKSKVPYTFAGLFANAVNGHIAFTYNGYPLYGFPYNMSVKPGFNETQEWKLLASPLCQLPHLQDLIANPINSLNMATYGLSFSKLCPVQFVPQGVALPDVYNHRHMDAHTYAEQSTRYQGYRPYCAKWQTNDIISLQAITRDLGPVQIDVLNEQGQTVNSQTLTQIITTAVQAPYQLFEGDITLAGLEPGHYQLRCTAGIDTAVVTFLSEWIHVDTSWPTTLLLEYSNTRNQAAMVFSTGYNPSFRLEGNLIDFAPRSRFTSYEDEPANMHLIEGIAYREFVLFAGDGFGLPPYVADKLNRILTLDTVRIDGRQFARAENAQLEPVNRVNGMPGTWWRIELREALNTDNTSLTTDGQLNQAAVLINVDTALFGDLTGQVSSNPVQVEVLNP